MIHIHYLPAPLLDHPQLASGICHIPGGVGAKQRAELKMKCVLFFEYFLLIEEEFKFTHKSFRDIEGTQRTARTFSDCL